MTRANPIQLQKHLKGLDYPATKGDLIAKAEENGVDENIRSMLDQLPEQEFNSPTDVSKALSDME